MNKVTYPRRASGVVMIAKKMCKCLNEVVGGLDVNREIQPTGVVRRIRPPSPSEQRKHRQESLSWNGS